MKRLSVGLPPEIEQLVIRLRKTDEYCMCSYADILRMLMKAGAERCRTNRGRRCKCEQRKKPRWGRGDGTSLLRAGNGGTRSGQESAAVFPFCRNAGMERGIPQGIDHRAYFGARPVSSKRCIGGANGSVGKDSPCIYICVITARHFWQSVVLLHSSHPLQNATGLPSVAIATRV